MLQMVGDELRLKLDSLSARLYGRPWEGTGHVLRLGDGEVALEMRNNNVPADLAEVRDGALRGSSDHVNDLSRPSGRFTL